MPDVDLPLTARPHSWAAPGEEIQCPRGHVLHTNAVILSEALVVCAHKPAARQGECGTLVFVMRMPGPLGLYVTEVNTAELKQIRKYERGGKSISTQRILSILGLELPTRST